jgi:hypothetical protein
MKRETKNSVQNLYPHNDKSFEQDGLTGIITFSSDFPNLSIIIYNSNIEPKPINSVFSVYRIGVLDTTVVICLYLKWESTRIQHFPKHFGCCLRNLSGVWIDRSIQSIVHIGNITMASGLLPNGFLGNTLVSKMETLKIDRTIQDRAHCSKPKGTKTERLDLSVPGVHYNENFRRKS